MSALIRGGTVIDMDEKTPAETPGSILKEIRALSKVTERVSDQTLEIKGDIKLVFDRLDRLSIFVYVAFGFSSASLVVSLFTLYLVVR